MKIYRDPRNGAWVLLGLIFTTFIVLIAQCGCNGAPDPDPQTLYINFHTVYNLQPNQDASWMLKAAIDSLNGNSNYTDGYFIVDQPGTYILGEGIYKSNKPYTILIGEEY